MRNKFRSPAIIASAYGLLTLLLCGLALAEGSTNPPQFLAAQGTELMMDGRPFREIGVNKYDLFLKFLAGGPDREQARGAIEQAGRQGLRVIRFNAGGYYPADLKAWPEPRYWQSMDELVATARATGVWLIPTVNWNTYLFPDLAGETVQDMLTNRDSKSRQYLECYIDQIVTRYRDEPTILFWELTNELNLGADLEFMRPNGFFECNPVDRGCPPVRVRRDNYTTEQMIRFIAETAQFIRQRDSKHLIGSGYAVPRAAAQHLRHKPGDWTSDSLEDLEAYLRDTHPDPVGLISVHLYSANSDMVRLGNADATSAAPLRLIKQACDRIGKPLYLGETGDAFLEGNPPHGPERLGFIGNMLDTAVECRLPLTLLWQWQSPGGPGCSISPEDTPQLLERMRQAQARLQAPAAK